MEQRIEICNGCVCVPEQNSEADLESPGITYSEHLQLPKLLNIQRLLSTVNGDTVNEEHMFIITHQTYELWFKQVVYDIDCLRQLFSDKESKMLDLIKVIKILERIKRIFKLLIHQLEILETMTSSDFMNFRRYLKSASGYQSVQFRLIENKLGVQQKNRICYNQANYKDIFHKNTDKDRLNLSEIEPSLFDCIQIWLIQISQDYSTFFSKYRKGVQQFLAARKLETSEEDYEKIEKSFNSVLDEELHKNLIEKGERRLQYPAFKCALCISFHPHHNPSHLQILDLLIAIDSNISKWRHNHVLLAQKMLGGKQGTGGSSGYSYLRSTIGDRYKVFLDLVNISNWVIPQNYFE